MIQTAAAHQADPASTDSGHTLWGVGPGEVHDRFWAARGVQVVRLGDPAPLSEHAEHFLLTDPGTLVIFGLSTLMDTISWLKPRLVFIRLHDTRESGYHERVISQPDGSFVAFKRIYDGLDLRQSRIALTSNRDVAEIWRSTDTPREAWRQLRGLVERRQRTTVSLEGRVYNRFDDADVMQALRDIVQVWSRPDSAFERAKPIGEHVWADLDTQPTDDTRFVGSVWIGAGRSLEGARSVVGPAVLWDDPDQRPPAPPVRWASITDETDDVVTPPVSEPNVTYRQRALKRAFDIAASLFGLLVALPIFPLIALAIWLEDRGSPFFAHRRETLGGRDFPCFKFRTMRRDAEQIKEQYQTQNVSDGPHFFIENDPRITRVGYLLRKTNLDELPQLWNVLVGDMSIVGPRPSPRKENQYCPSWRETRLSVRPGITGLWQVKRSREEGRDFQEWIRYDIEYVEKMSFKLDLWIIFRTLFARDS